MLRKLYIYVLRKLFTHFNPTNAVEELLSTVKFPHFVTERFVFLTDSPKFLNCWILLDVPESN